MKLNMKVPLPFPKCKECGKVYETSIHSMCGGEISIDISNDEVYCEKCKKHWNIWDSNYHCSCGATFKAKEVQGALTEVLAFCRACAVELKEQELAKARRKELSEASLRNFATAFFEKLGYTFGVTLYTLIETFVKFFKWF